MNNGSNVGSGPSGSGDELTFATLTTSGGSSGQNQGTSAEYSVMQEHDGDDDGEGHGESGGELREQDRFLPIANVARIMKKSIPSAQGKIAKDARECVQECVSEFISFITSEASDRCQAEKRKTINGEDILFAMSTLGFDNYVEPLKLYLQKYREAMKGDKHGEGDFEGIGDELLASNLQAITAAGIGTDESGNQVLLTYTNSQQYAQLN